MGKNLYLSNRQPSEVRCVYYEEPPTSLSMLLGAESGVGPAAKLDLAQLLDLTAPRPLYLNPAWLPSTLRQLR